MSTHNICFCGEIRKIFILCCGLPVVEDYESRDVINIRCRDTWKALPVKSVC